MLNRKVEFSLLDILDLINCSTDYGFADDVLFFAFAGAIKDLSADEIECYANHYLNPECKSQGYTVEDRDNALELLTDWRSKWLPVGKSSDSASDAL
jgi:hypothetical protein